MHIKKRTVWCVVLLGFAVLLGVAAFANDLLLHSMVSKLDNALGRSAQVESIEVSSICGKLNGNGNGVQYFGAALVKTDSEEAVRTIVRELKEEYEVVDYCVQAEQNICVNYLEHKSLSFQYASFQDGTYYCIYFYNSHHDLSNALDLRGR